MIFVFSCYTGLAYNEISQLQKKHIVTGFDGELWIEMVREKTQKNIAVPILPKAQELIDKYFDENSLATYLNLNIKVLKTDFITFDDIHSIDAKNVYVPYVNINNYLFQNFGEFEYQHHSSILVEKLLKLESSHQKKMYINIFQLILDH